MGASSKPCRKSSTLKTAHAPMSDVVIKNIANRMDGTDEIICPGPLFPMGEVPDISYCDRYRNIPMLMLVAPSDPINKMLLLNKCGTRVI